MEERHLAGQTSGPALATTYEGNDPRLLERICPLVDYLEISPDSISQVTNQGCALNPAIMAELNTVARGTTFLIHGVGLSIASASGWSQDYIRLLDELFSRLPVAWHSEHLAYTMVEGEQLGTMLPPPRTQEALDMLCERISFLQARYKAPFLLEKVVRFLPEYPGDYSEAEFLNALARHTGCGLLLDVYNLECDQKNFAFDIDQFLRELDLRHVVEMHLAGGVEYAGFQVDVHSQLTQESTLAIAANVLARAPHVRAVTFEYLKEAIPRLGHDAICGELQRLRRTLLSAEVGHAHIS
jgi:uncharacterized protein